MAVISRTTGVLVGPPGERGAAGAPGAAGAAGPTGPAGAAFGQNPEVLSNGLNSNVPTGGQSSVRVTGPTAAFSLGGLQFASVTPGQTIDIINTTSQPMTIVHEDLSSTAGNRINTQSGVNVTLPPRKSSASFVYDGTTSRWVLRDIGFAYRTKYNIRDFGAVGDGVHDDTSSIQAAVNTVLAAGGGRLYFPLGTYKITSTITFAGTVGLIVFVEGEFAVESGTTILWKGSDGAGPMFEWYNATGYTMSHIALIGNGNGLGHGPLYCLRVREDPGSGLGSSEDLYLHRCTFGGASGAGSAAVWVGNVAGVSGTPDIAGLRFAYCQFIADMSGGTRYQDYAFFQNTGGNVKNFHFSGCEIQTNNIAGIAATVASGVLEVDGCSFADAGRVADVIHSGVGSLHMKNCESEAGDGGRLLFGQAAQYSSAIIESCVWNGVIADAHTLAGGAYPYAFADVIIAYSGFLKVQGCQLASTQAGPHKVYITYGGPSANAGLVSIGNFYGNNDRLEAWSFSSDPTTPTGNPLSWGDVGKSVTAPQMLVSIGDVGGTNGTIVFPSIVAGAVQNPQQQLQVQSANVPLVGGTAEYDQALVDPGYNATSIAKITVPFSVWKFQSDGITPAGTSNGLTVAFYPAKTRILSVIAQTTVNFAGPTGPIHLKVDDGYGAGDDLLLSHVVSTGTPRKGEVNGDLGASLAAAAGNAYGHIPSWTGQGFIFATMSSDSGNLGGSSPGLTAGSVTFYVVFQRMQ